MSSQITSRTTTTHIETKLKELLSWPYWLQIGGLWQHANMTKDANKPHLKSQLPWAERQFWMKWSTLNLESLFKLGLIDSVTYFSKWHNTFENILDQYLKPLSSITFNEENLLVIGCILAKSHWYDDLQKWWVHLRCEKESWGTVWGRLDTEVLTADLGSDLQLSKEVCVPCILACFNGCIPAVVSLFLSIDF